MKVSIVLPIYNEEENIPLLLDELITVAGRIKHDAEFIFVDDGSTDASVSVLLTYLEKDNRVKVVQFSRNFGHQIAITAGIDAAIGDAVIVMDSDLQDPPSLCTELIEAWEQGAEVVYAQRRTRKDSWFKRKSAFAFYRLLNALSDVRIPPDTGDFRLMDRRVVDELKKMREHNRFMRGLASYVGFRQECVLFDRDERRAGDTKYPFKKMLRLSMDAFLGFSTMPLQLISRVGFLVSGLSALGILYALFMKIFFPAVTVSGWTFLIIAILFTSGVQMIMLGVIGGYMGRIYDEVRNRPLYIISRVHEASKKNGGKD